MDRKEQLASDNLFAAALGKHPLGDYLVITNLLNVALNEILELHSEGSITEEAIDKSLMKVANILLGRDEAYTAVPGWHKPGGIDTALAEQLALETTDPAERVATYVGDIIHRAIQLIGYGQQDRVKEEQWRPQVNALITSAALTLAGVPEEQRQEFFGEIDQTTDQILESLDPSKTVQYLTKSWEDYP